MKHCHVCKNQKKSSSSVFFLTCLQETDPISREAIKEQLGSGHLPRSQLILQSLNFNALQQPILVSTYLCIKQRQTFATLQNKDRQSFTQQIILLW